MTGVSGFGYLSSGAGPESSHAIGVSSPYTVWAVVPLLRGGSIKTRTASSYAGVQEVCISPAQRDKKCAFRRHNVGVARSQCSVLTGKF